MMKFRKSIKDWTSKNKKVINAAKLITLIISTYLLVTEILNPFQTLLRIAIFVLGFYSLIKTIQNLIRTKNIKESLITKANIVFLTTLLLTIHLEGQKNKISFLDEEDKLTILSNLEKKTKLLLNSDETFLNVESLMQQSGDHQKTHLRIPNNESENLQIETNNSSIKVYLDKSHTHGEKFKRLPPEVCLFNQKQYTKSNCKTPECNSTFLKIKNFCEKEFSNIHILQAQILEMGTLPGKSLTFQQNSARVQLVQNKIINISNDCLITYIAHAYDSSSDAIANENIIINSKEFQKLDLIVLDSSGKLIIALNTHRTNINDEICYIHHDSAYLFAQRIEI